MGFKWSGLVEHTTTTLKFVSCMFYVYHALKVRPNNVDTVRERAATDVLTTAIKINSVAANAAFCGAFGAAALLCGL